MAFQSRIKDYSPFLDGELSFEPHRATVSAESARILKLRSLGCRDIEADDYREASRWPCSVPAYAKIDHPAIFAAADGDTIHSLVYCRSRIPHGSGPPTCLLHIHRGRS